MEGDHLSDPPFCEEEVEVKRVEEGESLLSSVENEETCNIKPIPPPVPPKPSKSKETSLGQTLVPIEVSVLLVEDQNQSFRTDDEPAGDNLALKSSSISESFHLSQQTNNRASGDEAENPSQVSVIGEESKTLCPNSITVGAINQEHLITPNPSNSTDTNAATTGDLFPDFHCPFYKLHHKTSCEFLNCPEILENDKSILFGIDDFSSKVEQKIGFIVENLKDCAGIWPIMFLEKLNKIIVHCEPSLVQSYFLENSGILNKLVQSFGEVKKCSMVFRYYCAFYNLLAKGIVPFSTLASTPLLARLQRDFILASNESCRCSDGVTSKENCSQNSDDQHPIIEFEMQLQILAILMIPLITARAGMKGMKSANTDVNSPDPKTFVISCLRGMSVISKAGRACHLASEPKDIKTDTSPDKILNSNENIRLPITTILEKATLVHLLMAYNLKFEEAESNPIAEVLIEEDLHRDFIMHNAISALYKEQKELKKGCYQGVVSQYHPIGVTGIQMLGIRGPAKLIISMLEKDDSMLGFEDAKFLLAVILEVRAILSQGIVRTKLDEKTSSQIISECVKMDVLLESRLEFLKMHGGCGDCKSALKSREMSISSLNSDCRSSTVSLSWAIGVALKNCFGFSCVKAKKKVQKAVSPATIEEIDETKCLDD